MEVLFALSVLAGAVITFVICVAAGIGKPKVQ
jgi:hypothetical protein